jgi:peptidyl-prolyl cis-trans isomerase B (cyclophilin B)
MKRILILFTVIVASATVIFCSSNKKEIMENTADKPQANKEQNAKHPQYEISVTQKGVSLGKIIVETFPETAPKMCHNFDSLVSIGFYNGTAFHRVIPGFMIQGGDPNSKNKTKDMWGMGDPTQTTVPAEFSNIPHKRGILSTARSNDPNSATSQFFIMHGDSPHLDGKYTVFGKVLDGLDVVDKIVSVPTENPNRPIDKVEMTIVKK